MNFLLNQNVTPTDLGEINPNTTVLQWLRSNDLVGSKEGSDGLGLAYINTIISKNGGFIKLEKEKDITAFNIFLPLKNERR